MRKIWETMKQKGFYIAFGTGLAAFATLVMVYNYNNTRGEMKKEKGIDLNQPVIEDTEDITEEITTEYVSEKVTPGELGMYQDESEYASSDGALVDKEEGKEDIDSEETSNESALDLDEENDSTYEVAGSTDADGDTVEDSVEASSDGVVSEGDESEIVAGLEYDGSQVLTWPLVGNVILPFSMDTTIYFQTLEAYKCNPGMMIEGEEGANVIAAYEGVVESIKETKEFGTVIEINMGNGYKAKYGQLMNVCVNEGDTVTMAQNIGEVAPVSSYYTEEGNHLYFAITKDDEPVNPMLLIN